jgi:hypothetical protein
MYSGASTHLWIAAHGSFLLWYISPMRYNVSKHAKQGQKALRRKLKGGMSAYMSMIGKRGSKQRWVKKREPLADST